VVKTYWGGKREYHQNEKTIKTACGHRFSIHSVEKRERVKIKKSARCAQKPAEGNEGIYRKGTMTTVKPGVEEKGGNQDKSTRAGSRGKELKAGLNKKQFRGE